MKRLIITVGSIITVMLVAITTMTSQIFFSSKAEDSVNTPKYLYKIISLEDWNSWNNSLVKGELKKGSIDQTFIHLATVQQLSKVINKFWDKQSHVILKLETSKILGDLRFENNPAGSNKYFHLYNGSVPLEAVTSMNIRDYSKAEDKDFTRCS